ncbi:hypothetical protein EJ08DRAFT_698423 [Tothia fuscella]|uniref:Mediator of RNA polymerase II transcription subunit 7 n=1 Tax=Tothia fuscella TaxID=1048955 RepID=A0A9P4NQ76_9PEZI|nr:hypothetical protein EJ08DRAFT_698423 [Tothia fuscella]
MAEQQLPVFPRPPPFFKDFTASNLQKLQQLKDAQSAQQLPGLSAPSLLDLPPELRSLIPPEPPADGKYRSFGAEMDISDPLPNLNHRSTQLYPAITSETTTRNLPIYLRSLLRSLLLKFLELCSILSLNPSTHAFKIKQMETLVFNAHALINEYRPHQARESLILLMQEQIERKRSEIERVKGLKERVGGLVGDFETEVGLLDGVGGGNVSGVNVSGVDGVGGGINGVKKETLEVERWKEEGRAVWDALDEEMGD